MLKTEAACVVIQADGRTEGLQMLDNASVDCIVTDHPWKYLNRIRVVIVIYKRLQLFPLYVRGLSRKKRVF